MKLQSKAFTLVEVLLVSGLLAISSLAIFQSFSNGFKLWTKAQRLNREAEVSIFLEKLGEDLRSTSSVSGILFKGTSTRVSFPAIVITSADKKSSRASEGLVDQIGAVQYRFDPSDHTVYRRQANYSQALKAKWIQEESPVASGITALILHYDMASEKGFVLKSEIKEGIPSGVVAEVHFTDDSGEHQIKRYLEILVG